MALKKDIELNTGVIASYHMISSINKNYDISRGYEYSVGIETYLNEQARVNGKACIERSTEIVPTADSLPEIYALLKQTEKYKNSEDLLG